MRAALPAWRRLVVRLAAAGFAFSAAWLVGASPAPGQTWSSDQNISGGDVNETYTSLNGQRFAVTDDSSNLYIAFYDNRNKVSGDNNFEIYFRRFTYKFGSPSITRVTDHYAMSKYPALATLNWGPGDNPSALDSGRVYIAWQDARLFSLPIVGEPISYTIFFRTYMSRDGSGFGPEFQVSPYDSINAATSPVLTVGDASRVWIFWQKANNGGNPDIYGAVYDASTHTMGATTQITTDTAFSGSPTVAATRNGTVHLVWVDTRTGAQKLWTKRFVPGAGWTADEQLVFGPVNASASAPSLIATYGGNLHLVWRDSRDGNNEIYYKEYLPGTGWDPVDTRLTVNAFSQFQPQVDADPANNVYVVWTDLRNGPDDPADIYYMERKYGIWGAETPLVWAATDPSKSVQQFPGITHDHQPKSFVTWTDERLPASGGTNKDVYYKEGTGFVTAAPVAQIPTPLGLLRNAPNPFNPRTRIDFDLPRDAHVRLRVFDVRGALVRTLLDGFLGAGRRSVEWDGRDDAGRELGSGAYFLRLEGPGVSRSKIVNFLK